MKKIINKNILFGLILGMILCSGIVYGAKVYESNSIEYTPTDASWEVNNVNEAINSLHNTVMELETIETIGDATTSDILEGKTALVQGNPITGTMTNNGAWTNTPTENGKVTIPEGYHDGSGYVDTTSVYNAGYDDGVTATNLTLLTSFSAKTSTTTVDCTSIPNWQNKTASNFVAVVTSASSSGSGGASSAGTASTSISLSLTYNATTGKLTIPVTQKSYEINAGGKDVSPAKTTLKLSGKIYYY